jgi:hypothetical protein
MAVHSVQGIMFKDLKQILRKEQVLKVFILLSLKIWGLYYKTLQIRNLRQRDRFRSKLVTFGWDKYTNLNKKH